LTTSVNEKLAGTNKAFRKVNADVTTRTKKKSPKAKHNISYLGQQDLAKSK